MKTTFIYALKELAPGEFFSTKIRYIGKADDPYRRFQKHCVCKRKDHRGHWIRSLPARGMSLQLEILDEVPDLEWEFWEKEYVRAFRAIGFDLTNTTEGGVGICNSPPSVRAKQRGAKLGKKKSAEWRAEHRKRMLANPPNKGRKFSDDIRQNMGEAHRNKKLSNNKSGFVGVCWIEEVKKWKAQICVNTKRMALGHFVNLEDAVFVRRLAEEKYFS